MLLVLRIACWCGETYTHTRMRSCIGIESMNSFQGLTKTTVVKLPHHVRKQNTETTTPFHLGF